MATPRKKSPSPAVEVPAPPAPTLISHRNLMWLRADPLLLDQIFADKTSARLLAARPSPELCAVRPEFHRQLLARLERLGHTPEETGDP